MGFQQPEVAPPCNRAERDAKLPSYLVSLEHARFTESAKTALQAIALTDIHNRYPSELPTFARPQAWTAKNKEHRYGFHVWFLIGSKSQHLVARRSDS